MIYVFVCSLSTLTGSRPFGLDMSRIVPPSHPLLSVILLTLLLAVNFIYMAVLEKSKTGPTPVAHTYLGDDYPRTWDIGALPIVPAFSEPNTVHYKMHGADTDAEWAAMTPGNGFVYLGEQRRQFSLSVFHQLRCLDTLRVELARSRANETMPTELSRHCLNYLRQMVLCRADVALVPVLGKPKRELYPDIVQCSGWRQVYAAVKRNQEDHRRWMSAQ
ncbi:hypothetical protein BV25DRAFT_1478117 [Artomyces pyxidatus]|uniref:Uncharacterized protein n=1 Tax=Artomyces pyxidatus TaxID=48021 RepID=A0ACB8SMC7_9AGAM|nr:hypothetical protein BV25DRAFT_1478117 [Artomyces pyxidatus]